MLRLEEQQTLNFSNHTELYDILIDKDNFWKQLNEMVDFSFVIDLLKDK